MKHKVFAFIMCLMLVMAMTIPASADIGPKPSVQIEFTGMEGQTYYGTLLSMYESTGPASVWDGNPEHADYQPGEEGYDIWLKFVEYQDADGYYFLQWWWDCSETNQLNWTYYPPTPFKILLYFPETDTFYVSPVYERYAFDSYFTVDMSDLDADSMVADKSYDYTWEIISLAARIILTIALELAIALLFGYREKKVLGFLAIVNAVTQVGLNVALNIINYNSGSMIFTFNYVLLEILVFAIEAIAYAVLLKKFSGKEQKPVKAVGYALVANAASFGFGLWLAHVIPGIF
jgi:hypothetical protein